MAGQKSCEEVRLNSFTLEEIELPSSQNIYRWVYVDVYVDESVSIDTLYTSLSIHKSSFS